MHLLADGYQVHTGIHQSQGKLDHLVIPVACGHALSKPTFQVIQGFHGLHGLLVLLVLAGLRDEIQRIQHITIRVVEVRTSGKRLPLFCSLVR